MTKNTLYTLKVSLFLLLLLSFCSTIKAREFDLEQKGKITIKTIDLKTEKELSGIGVELIKIKDVNEEYEFNFTEDFIEANIDTVDENELAEQLSLYADNNNITGVHLISKDGKVVFDNLELGEYLVIIDDQDEIQSTNPFLIKVPQKNLDNYIYNLISTPKIYSQISNEHIIKPPLTSNKEFKIIILYTIGILILIGGFIYKRYEKE
jgi:hypothetical protein